MYDDCNKYIYWIGATEADSIQDFKRFIFHQLQQFIWLSKCAVPHHPMVTHNTGNQQVLHHLHVDDGSDIIQHIDREFSGLPQDPALIICYNTHLLICNQLRCRVCSTNWTMQGSSGQGGFGAACVPGSGKFWSVHPLCSRASGNEQWIMKHLHVLNFSNMM